jgi:hypothetical protein
MIIIYRSPFEVLTGSGGGKEGTKQIKGNAEESDEENEGNKIEEDIDGIDL